MYSAKIPSLIKSLKITSAVAFSIFFIQRFVFFIWSLALNVKFDLFQAIKSFLIGFVFDASSMVYILIPFCLFYLAFPRFKSKETGEKVYSASLIIMNTLFFFFILYMVTSEMFFWDEFKARYNFIAVDYLVYTTEVLKDIWESYPVARILSALGVVSLVISLQINKRFKIEFAHQSVSKAKLKVLSAIVLVAVLNFFCVNQSYSEIPSDIAYQEISKNGTYSIFYAYFKNEINYDQFYIRLDKDKAVNNVRASLGGEYAPYKEDIKREVLYKKNSTKMNVVLVLMESMGARFLKSYGNNENLTPNLDKFASQGLFFNNIYATGTRTVRGIEAITLSVPPTPGQSIVRRPNNEKLVTINSYFAKSGYDVQFLYGGYAYFDNMKYFFENNDARVLDLNKISSSDVTFSNAWGMSDEDLFKFSLKSADEAYSQNKPFFQIVLTTSNHRPFTYPDGRIDIASGSGRRGAVKYADYSIGKLVDAARSKKWFDNTLFVFVADHDAGVAGNTEVYKKDYLIPLIFYSPKMIKPQVISNLGSQIDVGPTLLGLLNMSYESFGFGYDLRKYNPDRAFISNYQKVGFMKKDFLTLLEPGKKFKQYKIHGSDYDGVDIEKDKDQLESTISFYQTASQLYKDNKLKSDNEKLIIRK